MLVYQTTVKNVFYQPFLKTDRLTNCKLLDKDFFYENKVYLCNLKKN